MARMIPVYPSIRSVRLRQKLATISRIRLMLLLLSLVLLTACTNSKLVISPLYNRFDDQIRGEFNKLGDWNEDQAAQFEAALGTYHVWHRQSELPKYASLISNAARSVAQTGLTMEADVQNWLDSAEQYSQSARECHPINFLFDLTKSITDKQVNFIERRFAREQKKNRGKYKSRTPKVRVEYRLKNIDKWAGRIGLEFTANQRAMLRTTLEKQISLRKQYYQLSNRWNEKLFTLARNQSATDYNDLMSAHIRSLWVLLESAYPEEWQENRKLWRDFTLRLINSLNDEQRASLSTWVLKLADTLSAIAEIKPGFVVGNDPSVGCLVKPTAVSSERSLKPKAKS
ncbi:MAG: DUF6279 family lipoprotein [Granulosicoccus sp.]